VRRRRSEPGHQQGRDLRCDRRAEQHGIDAATFGWPEALGAPARVHTGAVSARPGRPVRTRSRASDPARSTASASPAGSASSADVQAVIDRVAGILRARGERMTGPRRAVLAVLAERGEHLSADQVLDGVAGHDPSVHRASVYRTLEALSDLGVVQHVHVGHGGTAYHLVQDGARHLHAQCRICGAVHDLPTDLLDEVAARLSRRHAFVLDAGHVALSGMCRSCAKEAYAHRGVASKTV
jgi:Fur family ferric uptake transcriptional regulator